MENFIFNLSIHAFEIKLFVLTKALFFDFKELNVIYKELGYFLILK
jgi:hypothetical protein